MNEQLVKKMSQKELEEMRELALNSLYFFARAVLGWDWLEPHVHGEVALLLQDMPKKRLQFTLPRGFLKTTLCTISYCLWRALPPRQKFIEQGTDDPCHNPNVRILILQNSRDNARMRLNVIRQHMQNNKLLQTLFPEIIPDSFHGNNRRWSNDHAEINRTESHPEATWETAGVGTNLVSRHYTEIIEDDIIAPRKDDLTGAEAMPTRAEVEKAIGFHKSAISLLANPKNGRIINVGTRWSKYDVIQFIIDEQSPPFTRFELSAIDEDTGEATYPERFDLETLASIRMEQGTYIFSSQYLNKPFDTEKMVFKPDQIQYYDTVPEREEMTVYTAIDPAIGQNKTNDYSVVITAGVTDFRELFVLEYIRKRLDPSQLIENIFEQAEVWNPSSVIIESTAWQQALAHFTKKEALDRLTYLPIVEWKPGPGLNKELRIRGLQPIAQRRKLFLRPHHRELRDELTDFPYSKHDDVSDALATIKLHAKFPAVDRKRPSVGEELVEQLVDEIRSRSRKKGLPFRKQVIVSKRAGRRIAL